VFDPELFPQTQARVGGLERLRLCHFVADGGLAVCPPLHALLEDDACDADDSELWNPPLPTLRARAAAAAAREDTEPRVAATATGAAAAAGGGGRAGDPLHAVKQRVAFDLTLGHGLSNETAYQILQHAPEPVSFLQHVAGDRINALLQRTLPAGHSEFYLAKLQDLFRQGQAVDGGSWAPHPVLQRFVTSSAWASSSSVGKRKPLQPPYRPDEAPQQARPKRRRRKTTDGATRTKVESADEREEQPPPEQEEPAEATETERAALP
jgi:hypothetical protein